MKYKIEIEFDSDDLTIINPESHSHQILKTRLQMEVSEMLYNKMEFPSMSNLNVNIMKGK